MREEGHKRKRGKSGTRTLKILGFYEETFPIRHHCYSFSKGKKGEGRGEEFLGKRILSCQGEPNSFCLLKGTEGSS